MKYTLEERRARDREYYHKTRERRLELNKKRYDIDKTPFMLNNRKAMLKRKYNITLEEYEILLEQQEGVCFLCKGIETKRVLSVDHCHETGEVRGLLCGPCNRGIGLLKEDPDLLERAVEYLRSYGGGN